ncbi:MAG: DEAD/DEAH box helicase family protein [Deltaproteobacteria bacterium]|nr:DEAD/DEAH box helicase family protein [Deltaproteobacteria bacterium]
MPRSVIAYDKDLPEISGRLPWIKPDAHLVKDVNAETGWRVQPGRRESRLLLVPRIRKAVDDWREQGYPGVSDITRRLFEYWFEEDHDVPGFGVPFRYYFCQREAMETLAWVVEIASKADAADLIRSFAKVYKKDLFSDNIVFQTTMDGRRQIVRYVPELGRDGIQDLPPENLCRLAFKMATGSGKTWVMAMAMVWSHFHRKRVPGSALSTNFLVVAPNVIVYQRLEKDFAANRVFHQIPLIPPEWRGQFHQKVILRGEASEPDSSGNLFLTNIHQLYESREQAWTPANAVETLLGKKPAKDLAASAHRSMLERVKSLKDLVVFNDEAHHVHDEELAWSQSLLAIHQALPKGLALWLDFSATPKDQNGMYFPWTVCDYPLAQAVEDRIVKAPLIVTKEDDPKQPAEDPDSVTKENVAEKYGYWLRAAVQRWREHYQIYKQLGQRPVLFIMAEKNAYADALGEYLRKTKEFGFRASEILVIHTDAAGEITKKDLEKAREAARDIDKAESRIKAIVSVMMLREGWDVRNVTVVLGLRPFTAKAEILPEQVIGRGLRVMAQISPDKTQTLEVLGTRNLLKVVRDQLEAEGVGVTTTKTDPPRPVIIQALLERSDYDITLPITKPRLEHNLRKLGELNLENLEAIYEQEELSDIFRVHLKLQFATTQTEVHQADITGALPQSRELIASITNKVIDRAKLPNHFAELYPIVRGYLTERCFGNSVNLEAEALRSHLARLELQEGIAKYLARKIAELTVERRALEFEKADFKLAETKPFSWRRNLPPLKAAKTVFNYVATYNDFERRFAEFLDRAPDVLRFASLGTTEQGDSGTRFRVDYIKPSGAIGFYHPDWAAVQGNNGNEINWIIETKGRIWEGTRAKDEAITSWCRRVSEETNTRWQYIRINQKEVDLSRVSSLDALVRMLQKKEPSLLNFKK